MFANFFPSEQLIKVPGNTKPNLWSGYLLHGENQSQMNERFFLLLPDFVLYIYQSQSDASAIRAIPLPGYSLALQEQLQTLKLYCQSLNKVFFFKANSEKDFQRFDLLCGTKIQLKRAVFISLHNFVCF